MKDIDKEIIELINLCQGQPVKISWNGDSVSFTPTIPNTPGISELQKAIECQMLTSIRLSKYKMPELHMYMDGEAKFVGKNSNLKATKLLQHYFPDMDDMIMGDVIVFPSWYIL
jgi:hypothetical protein